MAFVVAGVKNAQRPDGFRGCQNGRPDVMLWTRRQWPACALVSEDSASDLLLAPPPACARQRPRATRTRPKSRTRCRRRPSRSPRAKQAFNRYCANCHGLNAEGSPGNDLTPEAPDLTDKAWKHGSTDGEIFNAIKNGVAPEFNMGAFGDQLKDEDIWKVVNYIRISGEEVEVRDCRLAGLEEPACA